MRSKSRPLRNHYRDWIHVATILVQEVIIILYKGSNSYGKPRPLCELSGCIYDFLGALKRSHHQSLASQGSPSGVGFKNGLYKEITRTISRTASKATQVQSASLLLLVDDIRSQSPR